MEHGSEADHVSVGATKDECMAGGLSIAINVREQGSGNETHCLDLHACDLGQPDH